VKGSAASGNGPLAATSEDGQDVPRVLLVAQGDPLDPRTWSGTPHYLSIALRDRGLLAGTYDAGLPIYFRLPFGLVNRVARLAGRPRPFSSDGREQWAVVLNRARLGGAISRGFPGQPVSVLSVSSLAPLPVEGRGCFYVDSIIPQWTETPYWGYSRRASERLSRVERAVLSSATRVFTLSEWARAAVVQHYGFDPGRVISVGGGLSRSRPPAPKPVESCAARRLLFVGVDWQRKGGPLLLEALRLAREKEPGISLDVAGASPDTRQSGVRVHGFLAWQDLSRLYGAASLFVMPSYHEAWGSVFVEAAASGLPSIGLNRAATPEIILDGVTGRLVEPDARQLADVILELTGDPDRLRQMGQAARARVQDWTWDRVVERMLPGLVEAVSV
jgi:glycosyltransferase involved in cell wall biosynthesis